MTYWKKKKNKWDQQAKEDWLGAQYRGIVAKERGGWATEAAARRKYKNQLTNLGEASSRLKTQVGGADYTKDTGTLRSWKTGADARRDKFAGLVGPNMGIQTQFQSDVLPWDLAGGSRHTWDMTDQMGLQGLLSGIPSKSAIGSRIGRNISDIGTLQSDASTRRGQWDRWSDQQRTDLERLEGKLSGWGAGTINVAGLAGGGASAAQTAAEREKSQSSGFTGIEGGSNLFASDLGYGTRYSDLIRDLKKMQTDAAAEKARVTGYKTGLETDVSGYETDLAGYGIKNKSELDTLLSNLLTKSQGLASFSSPFSSETFADLSGVKSRISNLGTGANKLLGQRTAEEERIQDAIDDYLRQAGKYKTQAGRLGTKSLSDIEDVEAGTAAERATMGQFKSDLDFDFSGAKTALTEAETAAEAARQKRFTELAALKAKADPFGDKISGTPLYDEAAMKRLLTQIASGRSDVAAYGRGDKADEALKAYGAQTTAGEERLEDLATKRAQLEQTAQAFLTGTGLGYTGLGQVGAAEGSLAALKAEIDKFKSVESEDELAQIMAKLQAERARLTGERDIAASRPQGNVYQPQGYNFGLAGRMSPEEYLALVSRRRIRDDDYLSGGTFSSLV